MRQNEITSFEQASEDLYNKAREALKVLSTHMMVTPETQTCERIELLLPKHAINQLVAVRNAVWEQERWMVLND